MESNMNIDIKSLTMSEIEKLLLDLGEKSFRAKQIFRWIYKGVNSIEEMTDLSKELRNKLAEHAVWNALKLVEVQKSALDGTQKYLFDLGDGNSIESVFMKYRYGNSICISSQAGCRMGCSFCASGINGLQRNLTPGEMADQILFIERDTGERINHIVVMGTGEPFDNYDNLIQFIQNVHQKDGLHISLRNITVSTCGMIPKMIQFQKDLPQVNLAVSLHAPNDMLRNQLMPINKKYPMEDLLGACRDYVRETGRRITFEYALIQGWNDEPAHGRELANRLKGMNCHVNLIPLNQVDESELSGTERKKAERFRELLEKQGIQVTIRRELGSDIDAACGQLRLKNNV